jgi:signal transduction histidine kinase
MAGTGAPDSTTMRASTRAAAPAAVFAAGKGTAGGALWRALAVFRVASWAFTAVQGARVYRDYEHPAVAITLLVVMGVWTVAVSVLQPTLPDFSRTGPWRPRPSALAMVAADLSIAVLAVLAAGFVDSYAHVRSGAPILQGTWAAGAVIGAGVVGGARLGVVGALVVSAAFFVERAGITASATGSATLLILAGLAVGYLATAALQAEQQVAAARAFEGARGERDRLARAIHDGVLQALTLIAREAGSLPPADVAHIAAEQERALRAYVTALVPEPTADRSRLDVAVLLAELETAWPGRVVSMALPAQPVWLPARVATELAAATRAALDNVHRHAGDAARAWVLVEDEDDAVTVTVRDNGVGMESDRPAQAAADGRIGLAGSIIGRICELGGVATVTAAPGAGVEVEMRVPRG